MSTERQKITLTCEVDSYRSGWTIVRFLAHRFKYHTAERWTARVADGWVLVNGLRVAPDHEVKKGDAVTYTIFHTEPEVDFRYEVVYEDDWLLAISKSGNLPVHACGVYIRNTLIATLKNIYGDSLNLAHRLDRETSGITLLTKDPQTARAMGKMFAEGEVSKLYAAVVHGRVVRESFVVDAPIGKTLEEVTPRPEEIRGSDLAEDLPRYVPRRRVDHEKGKPAVTRFEVERYLGGCTLVRAIRYPEGQTRSACTSTTPGTPSSATRSTNPRSRTRPTGSSPATRYTAESSASLIPRTGTPCTSRRRTRKTSRVSLSRSKSPAAGTRNTFSYKMVTSRFAAPVGPRRGALRSAKLGLAAQEFATRKAPGPL